MIKRIFTKEQFFKVLESEELKRELEHGKKLSDKVINGGSINISGFCQICEKQTKFLLDSLYSADGYLNFRERLICPICGLNNRQRFLLGHILKITKNYNDCQIYIYEQVTSFYNEMKKIYPKIIGSEYLGVEYNGGSIVKGIRHEDSTCLSFSDNSFDLILSLDVFEHVFDLEKSFKEAFRILKPNGRMIFSIPFKSKEDIT